ncbi:hypothetical protein [Crassaminicella profunda]|uniref:hypothetical protein n=1 Tax=Crassaminicella profunda TaxID=1286698 RepID=UPI001CA6D715|nr:hypothetical protein [Crassaminicella profunda]QZY54906.1 hypothetical protein K7H06_18085 [Crassaminicella profunda]
MLKNKIIFSLIVLLLISITINYKEINKNKLDAEKNFNCFNLCIETLSNKLTKYDETGDKMYLIKSGYLASTIQTICYLNESPSHMPRNFFNALSSDICNDLKENSYNNSKIFFSKKI